MTEATSPLHELVIKQSAIKKRCVWSVGAVAKLLAVAPRTVAKWIDAGILEGWRVPNINKTDEGDRRVEEDKLVIFCKKYGIPLPVQDVLLVGEMPGSMGKSLDLAGVLYGHTFNPAEAGALFIRFFHKAVFFDQASLGRTVICQILEFIHQTKAHFQSHVVVTDDNSFAFPYTGNHWRSDQLDKLPEAALYSLRKKEASPRRKVSPESGRTIIFPSPLSQGVSNEHCLGISKVTGSTETKTLRDML